MKRKRNVLFIDKSPITARGVCNLLSTSYLDIELQCCFEKEEIGTHLADLHPDLVIIDYFDNELFAALESYLKNNRNSTKIMLLNQEAAYPTIPSHLQPHVEGIVTKQCSEEEILMGVEAILRDHKFFCKTILNKMLPGNTDSSSCDPSDLSTREIQITKLLVKGNTNKEIANHLNISHHTVHTHRRNIMGKLEVNNITELIRAANDLGIQ